MKKIQENTCIFAITNSFPLL